MSRAPQRFGDSRLGEGVLAVWQAVTDSIPVSRTTICALQTRFMILGFIGMGPRRRPHREAAELGWRGCGATSEWRPDGRPLSRHIAGFANVGHRSGPVYAHTARPGGCCCAAWGRPNSF